MKTERDTIRVEMETLKAASLTPKNTKSGKEVELLLQPSFFCDPD